MLQREAGYIDARPSPTRSTKNLLQRTAGPYIAERNRSRGRALRHGARAILNSIVRRWLFDTEGFSTQDRWIYDARGWPQICSRPKAGFRLMPLTDAFEIIRAAVSNCRTFAIFATLNPLKLQAQQSYF